MTNAQILKDRIKKQCDVQGKSMTLMLSDLSLGVNAVNQINEKKGMGSFVLLQIADYLNCSVDYLLGRDEKLHGENSILSEEEQKIIEDYRALSEQGKNYILDTMDMVKEKYKKEQGLHQSVEQVG